jgi:hypothetical protein
MPVEVVAPATASVPRRWARFILAGPLVFLCSLLLMGGAHLWVPPGAGSVNHIVLPILLYPAIWTGLFFYACFELSLWRGYAVVGGLIALHVVLLALRNGGLPS